MSEIKNTAKHADPGYNDSWAGRISQQDLTKIADAINNIPSGRCIDPLHYIQGPKYAHRDLFQKDIETYLRIGDSIFTLPPSFIGVCDMSTTEQIGSMRQNGTVKVNQGYANREITVHLFFNGLSQVNGYEVDGPTYVDHHYVDGLRPLLAQFKSCPFLPIENELLNNSYGIHAVALSSISVETVEGFPGCLEAVLSLIEFDIAPYVQMPSIFYDSLIDWDLFRYSYQRLLNPSKSVHTYLPPIEANPDSEEKFAISSLCPATLMSEETSKIGDLTDEKYYDTLLSDQDNVHLTKINFGMSNVFPTIHMEGNPKPVMQYMGSSDARVNLVFETMDRKVLSQIEDLKSSYQYVSRQYKNLNQIGFIRIKNDLINMTGTEFFVLETLESTTVPEFPGLYRVAMSLIGFDIGHKKDNGLHQISPVDKKGTKEDAITQDMEGLFRKIKQDNKVELEMMERLELYPDLCLPKLSEIDAAITAIQAYRKKHGLAELSYQYYPREESVRPGDSTDSYYNGFADPDFFVFYPTRYEDLEDEAVAHCYTEPKLTPTNLTIPDQDYGEEFVQDSRLQLTDTTTTASYYGVSTTPTGKAVVNAFGKTGNSSRDSYVSLLLEQEGCGYVYGATGQIHTAELSADLKRKFPSHTGYGTSAKWYGKRSFDCSGLICWGMWQLGNWQGTRGENLRFTSGDMISNKVYFRTISESELQPGDICHTPGHVGVYIGTDENGYKRTIEAMSPDKGVCRGYVADSKNKYFTNFARPLIFEGNQATGFYTNSWSNVQYPTTQAQLNIEEQGGSGIRTDMRYDGMVSVGALNAHLINGLSGMGAMFRAAAQKHNVDPALLAAICKLETGHGTSNAFKNHNNPSGTMDPATNWTKLVTFSSVQAGLEYTAKNLSNNYIAKGLTTISAIGGKYCPVGAANDPNGTNKNWIPTVTKFYNEIKATAYSVDPSEIGNVSVTVDVNGTPITNGYRGTPVTPAFGYTKVSGQYEFKQTNAGKTIQSQTFEFKHTAPTLKTFNSKGVTNGQYEVRSFARPYVQTSPALNSLTRQDFLNSTGLFNGKTYRGQAYNPAALKDLRSKIHSAKLEQGFIGSTSGDKLVESMCVDMATFEKRGRLLRAFPTFVFMMVDDGGEWLDGRKLWSNFYLYRSVLDIQIVQESSQPVHTAMITVNDAYDILNESPSYPVQLYRKTMIENDEGYLGFIRTWYKWTGSLLGGPKLTDNMVDLKNYLHSTVKLQAGARIHIRSGYGSNPVNLPINFNGVIAEITHENGVVQMVAQSNGVELLSTTVSAKENEKNGFFKFQSEPSNIIASLLSERKGKLLNILSKKWGEPSEYGIESFGINFGGFDKNLDYTEQYDLTKNIFVGKYDPMYFTENAFLNLDGEDNFNFSLYGKYPWDCMQMCAQFLPEFVCQPVYHQFESRIFYGLPFYPNRYRYDILDENKLETWVESSKSFAQLHILDSNSNIVKNKIKASSRNLKTNMVALYTIGSSSDETPVIYSDRTMDWSKQSTGIIDTTVVQDYIGPDKLYELVGLNTGKSAAIKLALSNLVDGWNKTYKGEIVVMGSPSIKPCDYIFVNDTHKNVKGVAIVRSVIHSISGRSGMTTAIVPSMVATTTTHYSGAANIMKSLLAFGNGVSSVYNVRSSMIAFEQYNRSWMSQLKGIALITSWTLSGLGLEIATNLAMNTTSKLLTSFKTGNALTRTADFFADAAKGYEAYDKATDLWKTAKASETGVKAAKAIKASIKAGSAGIKIASNAVPIVGPIVATIVIDIALNKLLESVVDYFKYKNSINIFPLYKEGNPFCVSTKGAKYIIPGATSTPYTNDEVEVEGEDDEITI